jgi:hypothetical protein
MWFYDFEFAVAVDFPGAPSLRFVQGWVRLSWERDFPESSLRAARTKSQKRESGDSRSQARSIEMLSAGGPSLRRLQGWVCRFCF